MDIAADGRIFLTERPGRVRVIENGFLQEEPVISLDVRHRSEGGLLGLVLDPAFEENRFMYVYHTLEEGRTVTNRVLRLILTGNRAEVDKVMIDQLPGANNHNGGRIAFGPDGMLYITVGDIYQTHLAQDLSSTGGSILRLHPDGNIPEDNPFPGSPIYSWGHRNPQGLDWHPVTGQLFSSEHGQRAKDEINIIEAGANNYGWPIIEGDEAAEGMRTPLIHSGNDTWAPSGITFITNGPWPNNLLVANLRGSQLLRFVMREDDNHEVLSVEALFEGEWGRIRSIYEGPDGSLYILTNNRDGRGQPRGGDDRIMRLVPLW